MCEGGAQQGVQASYTIIAELVEQNERDLERKERLLKEVQAFLGPGGSGTNGFPSHGLDVKSREEFQPLFSRLKQFLYDVSGQH